MRNSLAQQVWISAALFLLTTSPAWAEKERCVAGPDGQWRCGKNITDADAAPLPAPSQRITPPVLLIDPRRFGEVDPPPTKPAQQTAAVVGSDAPTPSTAPETEAVSAENSEAISPSNAAKTSNASAAAQTGATQATSATPGRATAEAVEFSAPTTGYAVQLSVASSPRGFGALLAKLGKRTHNFQQRQLRNGNWVLLLGQFQTIEAARAAIPSAIPGAFARNLADLSFN